LFTIVRNVAQRLNKHAGMEDVIVIGLSYARAMAGFIVAAAITRRPSRATIITVQTGRETDR